MSNSNTGIVLSISGATKELIQSLHNIIAFNKTRYL
jgi:hypothetical protein